MLLIAEGESVPGPILHIGNTNSRYRFPLGARRFAETWNSHGTGASLCHRSGACRGTDREGCSFAGAAVCTRLLARSAELQIPGCARDDKFTSKSTILQDDSVSATELSVPTGGIMDLRATQGDEKSSVQPPLSMKAPPSPLSFRAKPRNLQFPPPSINCLLGKPFCSSGAA